MSEVRTAESLLHAAHDLAPEIVAVRDEIERTRGLPAPLVARLRAAGLFQLWLPRALGGPELHPVEYLSVIEALAVADGAVGWCATNAGVYGLLAGGLTEQPAREIFGNGGIVAGSVNPTGRADAVAGGFRVSGRWGYASGIGHADWVLANCIIHAEGKPRRTASGGPEMRFLFLPRTAVEVLDTWHVSGLIGTGSHDFQVADVLVAEEFSLPAFAAAPRCPGTLYRIPPISLFTVALASVVLGIARGALNALASLAATKTPMGSAETLRDKPIAQLQGARAEALARAARAHLMEAINRQWDEVDAGTSPTMRTRASIRLATSFCAEACSEVVNLVHATAGGSAIQEMLPIARCFRDIHAATQHIGLNASGFELAGRVLFGLDPGTQRF
jgi:alkylation response protein AidB-like acyl-CoA dehydrogenase